MVQKLQSQAAGRECGEESIPNFDHSYMRVKELLLVLAVVALSVSLFGRQSEEGAARPVVLPTPESSNPELEVSRWTVHGVSPDDSFEFLSQRFGQPTRDESDETSRFTVFQTPQGELRRVEYFQEKTISLSGVEGELSRQGQVKEGMTMEQLGFLGKPTFTRSADDWVSHSYEGVEIYFRDGKVFGLVGYGRS